MKTRTTPADSLLRLVPAIVLCLALAATAGAQEEEAAAPPDEAAAQTPAAQTPGAALPEDGPTFPVGKIEIRYLRENPMHPPIEEAMEIVVILGETTTGYVAPRPDVPLVSRTLAEMSARQPEAYHASAIQHMLERIRDYYVAKDILGVYVAPDPTQITETGTDERSPGDTTLKIIVTTGIVTEMRTVAAGERVREGGQIPPDQRIDNTLHTRIIERSPIRPADERFPGRQNLLLKSQLDRYLFHLGRHPGRRVDASVAAAQEVGGIALDYIVTENHPIVWYFQISNTGTRSTDYVRERFGYFNTQTTFNDDILSLDYTTANFDQVHSFNGSYEAPFPNDRIRWGVRGSYSQYTAEDVGFFNNQFEGKSWSVAGEITANIHQKREAFIDLFGGLRLENSNVENRTFFPLVLEGDELFLFPYVGLRYERSTEWLNTDAEVKLECQIGDLTDVDRAKLNQLGRTTPDRDWVTLQWKIGHSVFLEPLLNREAWEDPTTPESSTLAHELSFSFRGQYAFDNRLIPQAEQVVGGLYTVRGYPESVVAGDTTLIGSVEYRYHIPRGLDIQPEPKEMFGKPFRVAPQYVYGVPDWDLILKGFFDVGRAIVSDKLSFESDETLYGAGVGLEFLYKRNVNIRLDWGFALDDLTPGQVNSGANRLHVVATFMY